MKALFALLFTTLASAALAMPRIAILIDDMGDNRPLGERALALKGAVSYAFLPHTALAPRSSVAMCCCMRRWSPKPACS